MQTLFTATDELFIPRKEGNAGSVTVLPALPSHRMQSRACSSSASRHAQQSSCVPGEDKTTPICQPVCTTSHQPEFCLQFLGQETREIGRTRRLAVPCCNVRCKHQCHKTRGTKVIIS